VADAITRFTELDGLPQFLSVPEFSTLLDLKESFVYEQVKVGVIPAVRLGRLVRISKATVIAYATTVTVAP
jgi:excisionase family DNA binding protein